MAFFILYSVTSLLYTFVIALIIATLIFKWFRERNYPPGPIGIPVFGYALFLGKKPNEKLRDLSQKYGDVFSFYLGTNLTICVSDYHLAKELLCNPKLLYRPEHISSFLTGRGGFGGMNGEEWQEQRRFTFYTMRNLGLGKGLWETMIQEAVADLTEELKNLKGQPKNVDDVFGFFFARNNIALLLGRHLDKEKDAEQLHVIHESTREFMKYFGQVSANSALPWLRKFLDTFHLFGYHKFYKLLRTFENIFKSELEKRMKSPESLERDDYIGFFYKEMEKRKTETGNHTFTMEILLGNLVVLFISSIDSTMSSIVHLFLYMAAHPDVQKRVQDEIDSVAGRDGIIYYDDRAKFPYTMATMYEMLRHVSIAPLNPPRIFYLGKNLNICVSDYHLAKELLCNPKLLYRPEHFADFLTGRGGFGGMNGEEWQEQRRFTFHTMRNLGLGKGLWETMIQEAVADLTEELKNLKGQPKDLDEVFGFFLAKNNISLLLGRHLDKEKDAEQLHIIRKSTREFMKYLAQVSANITLPWLRKFLENFHLFGYHKFYKLLRTFEDIFKNEMEERLKSPESLERNDYIGFFYKEMEKRETETENHTFTMEILLGNLVVLFISSNDSTMSSIVHLFLYMAAHPDVQKRVQDEIDSVAGRDGIIYYDDRAKFPYTMATVYEMLRHVSIAPLNPPRITIEDMTISGYHVPKGSQILVNLWSILHDPRYFKEPMEFNPERFFGENEKVSKNLDGFIPFSVGKRNCPGEGIALMTIFLYFASFMQKFKVTAPPGKKIDLEPIFGGAHMPKPQELCFIER